MRSRERGDGDLWLILLLLVILLMLPAAQEESYNEGYNAALDDVVIEADEDIRPRLQEITKLLRKEEE